MRRLFWITVLIALVAPASGLASRGTDLSSARGLARYLHSIGVDPATAIVQRGVRNYTGPHCPGAGWTCAPSTPGRPVVQLSGPAGGNQFVCTPSSSPGPNDCVIVQVSSGADNIATCTESSKELELSQSCSITQTNTSGANQATVSQTITSQQGSSQTAQQTTTISQTNGSGTDTVSVTQSVTQREAVDQEQTQESHQSLSLTQDTSSGGGDNSATISQSMSQQASTPSDAPASELQNATDDGPNVSTTVSQKSSSGQNSTKLTQTSTQQADAKATSTGAVTQQQSTANGGIKGSIDQLSSGLSTWTSNESETQHMSASTSGPLSQVQYGPIFCCSSQGTNPADTCTLTQDSTQTASSGAGGMVDLVSGHCSTSGNGSVGQTVTENGTKTSNSCSGSDCAINIGCEGGVCVSGSGALISVSPSSIAFGNQRVGTSSAAQTVTVKNIGSGTLNIGGVSLDGANPADFAISNDGCSNVHLDPGASCTVDVAFDPAAAGARDASVSIPSNAPGGPASVSLSGTGIEPVASVSPASIDFGDQLVNTPSDSVVVTVSNVGTDTLKVGDLSLSGADPGDFSLSSDDCSNHALAVGAICTVGVAFVPTTTGPRTASLDVPSDASNGTVSVALSGNGVAPDGNIDPTTIQFPVTKVGTSSAAQRVTLNSTGTYPLIVGQVAVSSDDFTIAVDQCSGASIQPGDSCSISVAFSPTKGGPLQGTLDVPTNAGPFGVALSGTGDGAAPATTITSGQILIGPVGDKLTGTATDDYAGVDKVIVTYSPVIPLEPEVTVEATLSCSAPTSCTWSAELPALPGIYDVNAHAVDKVGNTEVPGARAQVIIV